MVVQKKVGGMHLQIRFFLGRFMGHPSGSAIRSGVT